MKRTPIATIDHRITNRKAHNLTLTPDQVPRGLVNLLGLGPKFIPSRKFNLSAEKYKESLCSTLRSIRLKTLFADNSNRSNAKVKHKLHVPNPSFQPPPTHASIEAFFSRLEQDKIVLKNSKQRSNITKRQSRYIEDYKSQANYVFINADKNLGPCLIETSRYNTLILDHLNCGSYEVSSTNPRNHIIAKVTRWYRKYKRQYPQDRTTKIVFHDIKQTKLPRFYGLLKIHKNPLKIRPIVASFNTPTTGLSKWLAYKLQPMAERTKSFVKNSISALETITKINSSPSDTLITLDVVSLYTSIPLEQCIKVFENLLQNVPDGPAILEGLQLILKNNYFQYGTDIYHQTTGIAMGTNVAPQIATLYVAYFETRILTKFTTNLKYYGRYLDDVLVIWQPTPNHLSPQELIADLRDIPGLQWTFNTSTKQAIFLDLLIYKHQSRYHTTTYQKPSNLYQYPTSNTSHPSSVIRGMITGLTLTYHKQNSTQEGFNAQMKLLYTRLRQRGFTKSQLEPMLEDALKNIYGTTRKPPKPCFFWKIPFIQSGPSRHILKEAFKIKELNQLLVNHRLGTITICYTRSKNLGQLLQPTPTETSPLTVAGRLTPDPIPNPGPNPGPNPNPSSTETDYPNPRSDPKSSYPNPRSDPRSSSTPVTTSPNPRPRQRQRRITAIFTTTVTESSSTVDDNSKNDPSKDHSHPLHQRTSTDIATEACNHNLDDQSLGEHMLQRMRDRAQKRTRKATQESANVHTRPTKRLLRKQSP